MKGWTTPYNFLPFTQELADDGKPHLTEADGETEVPFDYLSVDDWKDLKLGPWHPESGIPTPLSVEDEEFFAQTLINVKSYRETVVGNPDISYPPIAILRSDFKPVCVGYSRPGPQEPFDFSSGRYVPGDTSCTLVIFNPSMFYHSPKSEFCFHHNK